MTDNNSEQYVIYNGKKVFVDNGRLDIDYDVESFIEIEGLNNLKNLKYLYIGPGYGIKRIENLETLTNLEELAINFLFSNRPINIYIPGVSIIITNN